jgi:hypothetical protein
MILLVQTYPGGNAAFERHWPYFNKAGATRIVGIGTVDGGCTFPASCEHTLIGQNQYINGSVLPQRLIDTLKFGIAQNDPQIVVCEYDTVFFHHLPIERMEHAVAGYYAGGQTWGSKAKAFFHNPWCFFREAAIKFVEVGQEAINEGVCGYPSKSAFATPEGSPDVFVGYVCEHYGIPIQGNAWKEYSRNDLRGDGYLEEARMAYLGGYDVLHGLKSKEELDYITR